MNSDAKREVEDPSPVREHRARAAPDTRTKIRIIGGAAAQTRKPLQLTAHLAGVEWGVAAASRFFDGLYDQAHASFKLVTGHHRGMRQARARRWFYFRARI